MPRKVPPTPLGQEIARRIDATGAVSDRSWALRHGVSYERLRGLLSGKSRLGRADTIQQIAAALHTTPGELIGEAAAISPDTPAERELVRLFRRLPGSVQRTQLALLAEQVRVFDDLLSRAAQQQSDPLDGRRVGRRQ